MTEATEGTDSEKTNTIDPARLKKEVARIEEAIAAKESHKMGYVEKCKPFNERVANAYEMGAKAAGIPMAVLKATIKQRALQRKIDGIPEKFEDETRETFEMVSQALGGFADTPLGKATVNAAKAHERKPRASRKAPSPDAAPQSEPPAGIDATAAAETEHPIFQAGFDARMADDGASIPNDLRGVDRDRWHAGWLAATHKIDGERNADRLNGGMKGMPGADAPGKVSIQ